MRGDCFQVAAAHVLADPDLTLVHGLPTINYGPHVGLRHWHAWVEQVRFVPVPELVEPVTLHLAIDQPNGRDRTVPVAMYYRLGRISKVWRYTRDEAIAMMTEHRTYGPWVPGWETMGA